MQGLPPEWTVKQRQYWDRIASRYDQLYASRWSQLEDLQTGAWLVAVIPPAGGTLLELGCGTGLGFTLCAGRNSTLIYTGLDISDMMLTNFRNKFPHLGKSLFQGSMDDLSRFKDDQFDCAIALNTSLSFSPRPLVTLKELFRVVRAGGLILVSFLGRWSLRRLARLKTGRLETFRTRGAEDQTIATPALTYSVSEIEHLLLAVGFLPLDIRGQSVFGGLFEWPPIWQLDCELAHTFPIIAHALNAFALKP